MADSVLLLESGSALLLEDATSKVLLQPVPLVGFHILLESGDSILLESGVDFLLLETGGVVPTPPVITPPAQQGGGYGAQKVYTGELIPGVRPTRRQLEDEEVLLLL